jgi:hypothetical protein
MNTFVKKMRSALAFLLIIVILCSTALSFTGCASADAEYIKSTGWDVDMDTFHHRYVTEYTDMFGDMQRKYSLNGAERYVDVFEDNAKMYMYASNFTLCLYIGNLINRGELIIQLYYYGEYKEDLQNYEAQKTLLALVSEIIDTIGFDTELDENPDMFLNLYNEAREIEAQLKAEKEESKGEGGEEDTDESDDEKPTATHYVFNEGELSELGYTVTLGYMSDPYFYLMRKEGALDDEEIPVNFYMFYGLMKTLPDTAE